MITRHRAFVAIVALQIVVLLGIAGFHAYARQTADTVVIGVETGDPQRLMTGAVPLEISRVSAPNLPGDDAFGGDVYVELGRGGDGLWHAVALHDGHDAMFDGTVLIRGKVHGASYVAGGPRYYVRYGFEDARPADPASLPAGSGHSIALVLDLDRFGNAYPQRYEIDGAQFGLH
jgi:hypothetical protein